MPEPLYLKTHTLIDRGRWKESCTYTTRRDHILGCNNVAFLIQTRGLHSASKYGQIGMLEAYDTTGTSSTWFEIFLHRPILDHGRGRSLKGPGKAISEGQKAQVDAWENDFPSTDAVVCGQSSFLAGAFATGFTEANPGIMYTTGVSTTQCRGSVSQF